MKITDKAFRVAQYLPDADDESLLAEANEKLAENPRHGDVPDKPVLFVTGSPRSGTTFMAQCVSRYLDVDYVDGLAAKFWRAPLFGMRLSRMIFKGGRASGFESEFGRAQSSDIHSFHYFWMGQLGLDTVDDLFSPCESRGVDWADINAHLAAMQTVRGRALAFKGYYPSYFMVDFVRHVPGSVFILIDRDPLEQAMSIHNARLSYNGEPRSWWSMQPPGVLDLVDRSPEEQIAGQIAGLAEFFQGQVEAMGPQAPVVRVCYEAMVADPAGTLEAMHRDLEAVCGREVPVRGELPRILDNGIVCPEDLRERLARALEARRTR